MTSPGRPIDPLDEVLDAVGTDVLLVELEHDDVAAVHVVEVVADLVDQHPVALLDSVGSIEADGM